MPRTPSQTAQLGEAMELRVPTVRMRRTAGGAESPPLCHTSTMHGRAASSSHRDQQDLLVEIPSGTVKSSIKRKTIYSGVAPSPDTVRMALAAFAGSSSATRRVARTKTTARSERVSISALEGEEALALLKKLGIANKDGQVTRAYR